MKSKFKRNNKVQSKHYGRGTVVKVKSDKTITYPVEVGFDESGLIRYYTRDGKYTVDEVSDKDITLVSNVSSESIFVYEDIALSKEVFEAAIPILENNTVLNISKLPFRVGSRVQHRTIEEIKGEIVRILDNGADYPVLILWDKDKNAVGLFNHEGTPYSISTDIQGKSWSKDEDPTVNLIQY